MTALIGLTLARPCSDPIDVSEVVAVGPEDSLKTLRGSPQEFVLLALPAHGCATASCRVLFTARDQDF